MYLRVYVIVHIIGALVLELKTIEWIFVKGRYVWNIAYQIVIQMLTFLITHDKSESECLQQCVRRRKYSAYNHLQNGTCQLLQRTGACQNPDELEGSSFVHLADCRGDIDWQVYHPDRNVNTRCMSWQRPQYGNLICPPGILRGPDNGYCVGVAANRGLYLPCWFQNAKYRLVSEDGKPRRCKGNGAGCLLCVRPNCSDTWQDYTVGDPVPWHAVSVNDWKNGSPLYIVAARFPQGWRIGYYLLSAKQT